MKIVCREKKIAVPTEIRINRFHIHMHPEEYGMEFQTQYYL